MDEVTRSGRPTGPLTLAIDVGGTHLKAGILSPDGHMTAGPSRVDTPHPAPPDAVVEALVGLAGPLGRFDRISIGFPGVVRDGRVLTAPNLDTKAWHGFPLAATLAERLGAPARLANDATVQGLGVIDGHGRGVRHHARHRHGLRAVRGRQARAASRAVASIRCAAARPTTSISATLRCARWGASAGTGASRTGDRLHRTR